MQKLLETETSDKTSTGSLKMLKNCKMSIQPSYVFPATSNNYRFETPK